jgi:hypothetical protein
LPRRDIKTRIVRRTASRCAARQSLRPRPFCFL